MADLARPLVFNLTLRADRERFARLYHHTDAGLSELFWRLFEEVASTWKLGPDELDWYQRRLGVVLNHLDAACLALGGPHKAMRDPRTEMHLQAAQRIVEEARDAYALQTGQAVIRGRATGGRNRARPPWHQEVIEFGKIKKSLGNTDQQVVVRAARAFRKSQSAVRRVLQPAGVIEKYPRAK